MDPANIQMPALHLVAGMLPWEPEKKGKTFLKKIKLNEKENSDQKENKHPQNF